MKRLFSFNSKKDLTKALLQGRSFIVEVVKTFLLASLIVIPIRYLIFQPFFVQGVSMYPNFHNGDYLIVDEITYRFRGPQRGEVIVFKYPQNPSQRYIKRIVGLPGETVEIENGEIAISKGKEKEVLEENYLPPGLKTAGNIHISLLEDEYFVLGDNRSFSSDSRRWGPLPEKYIIGRVYVRAWPLTALASFEAPSY